MAEIKLAAKSWEDMEADVLVKIFKELDMVESAPVSQVCRLWRLACWEPLPLSTLDLGFLKTKYIPTATSHYIWVNDRSERMLTNLFRIAMVLSHGNITCLIFHFNLYMRDDHLKYVAERCPNLKGLVMLAWNHMTITVICEAIRRWGELVTMPALGRPLLY